MRAFDNLTDNKKEAAVKKGTTLPPDAINLRMVLLGRSYAQQSLKCS
jgi:hypothetical protein